MSSEIPSHERGTVCPLCFVPLKVPYLSQKAGDKYDISCEVCGFFTVTGTFEGAYLLSTKRDDLMPLIPYLRAHVRQESNRGVKTFLSSGNYEELARAHIGTPVAVKLVRLLEDFGRRSDGAPGKWFDYDLERGALLLDGKDAAEVQYLLDAHVSSRVIETRDWLGTAKDPNILTKVKTGTQYRITPRGWEALAPISGAGRPGSCLVAMAFDKAMDEAYESGIKPAIEEDCGFSVVRVDKVQFNESINDRIIVGIRTAQFVVADVTLQRNGVYFEGGYAMGLGRPVIWTVSKADVANVHFDTRPLNHIVWTDTHDLRTKLATRIQGTIPGAKMPAV